ncbi:hypothetical protein PHYPSEUDO_009786 [Phytophthora pseudosyringae]|uniref:Uncharacterized protein n=1 Tax=Phytophthora pseudosyringae TaxID=221518 RepID=A0A8T1VCI2_9STRA|nr:hypothetical protein PHYPSEUDO_009786 [Phytophthora pseudosyringae]
MGTTTTAATRTSTSGTPPTTTGAGAASAVAGVPPTDAATGIGLTNTTASIARASTISGADASNPTTLAATPIVGASHGRCGSDHPATATSDDGEQIELPTRKPQRCADDYRRVAGGSYHGIGNPASNHGSQHD